MKRSLTSRSCRVAGLGLYLASGLIAACSAGDGKRDVTVGVRHGDDAATGASGRGEPAANAADSGKGSDGVDNALSVRVEDIRKMTIEVVTLACHGDCADVEAVADGGNPPYAFKWEDGSTNAMRRVCLAQSTTLHVSATDTPIVDDEFSYDAHTASVALTAEVLDCTDAGVQTPAEIACVGNPSFEGDTPGVNQSASGVPAGTPGFVDVGFEAAPWTNCDAAGSPDVWDEHQSWDGTLGAPVANDGATYLALYNVVGNRESTGQALCAPLEADKRYSFEVDIAYRPEGGFLNAAAGAFELWAGSDECGLDQLLFTSPIATRDWQTHCFTFTAEHAFDYIRLLPAVADGISGVFVDHIVSVASCPIATETP